MLRNELNDELKAAMRAKDERAVATLRLILAALKDRDIAVRSKGDSEGLGDEQILEMLQKMVRQRHDSIEMYEKGGREDLAAREREEIQIIERFLPKPLSDTETATAVDDVVAELEADSIKDMGRVMGTLKERYPGRMDFGRASQLVKQRLA
jgi:uncharacterized protein YqeY